jgi:hypothetical protein
MRFLRSCGGNLVVKVAADKPEQKVLDDISEYGHHVMLVGASMEAPGFGYSIGLFQTYAHPEIIIVGLKFETLHVLINNMAFDIKNGKTFETGEFHDDILEGFQCYVGSVPRNIYPEYLGWDLWYYEGDYFPLIQCVYPSVEGIFPWEKDFPDETKWNCPMLTDPPKEH